MTRRTWRQTKDGMVEVTSRAHLPEDLRVDCAFVSPIDGSVITNKRQLHDHNKRHNVEQTTEGHNQDWKERQKSRDNFYQGKSGKEERIEAIKETLYHMGERP